MQELWRPAVGWESRYEVSNLGRVRNKQGRVLRQYLNNDGYLRLELCGKEQFVHRLVGEAFLGPLPSGLVTRHGPGGQQDNRVENLCYGTPQENARDMHRDGTCPSQKLTYEQVVFIRAHKFAFGDVSRIAELFGVSPTAVSRVKTGRTFSTP